MADQSTTTKPRRRIATSAGSARSAVDDDASLMKRLIQSLLGDEVPGVRVEVYDGTAFGPPGAATKVRIISPNFFHRVITGLGSELAFGRAYVAGDVEIEGDIYGVLELRERIGELTVDMGLLRDVAKVLGIDSVGDLVKLRRLPPPPEETQPRGALHSRNRDSRAISAHYDVSNDFYRLFLGPTMTYSCAVFSDDSDSLDAAQINKYDLVCRKLGLRPGMRLLDIGCGWGGMVLHAAEHYGVNAVGITISKQQQELANERVLGAGLGPRIEIRLQDYRDVVDGPFDAISSIGMFEHVGEKRLSAYFDNIEHLLVPGGRLLNHAINRAVPTQRTRIDPHGFMGRYVFPDGELLEVGQVASAIDRSGLEVRHVESLREHYALTLRHWVRRLEENWDEAVELTSIGRARVWRLYMAASAIGFESAELNVTQVLAVKPAGGVSGLGLRPKW